FVAKISVGAIGPPPAITSISPTSGTQGQTISNFTVNGNNFQPNSTLSFSGNPADFTITYISPPTSTQIFASVTIAATAGPGARDVTASNPDGQQAILSGAFTVMLPKTLPPPSITSVSPFSGIR